MTMYPMTDPTTMDSMTMDQTTMDPTTDPKTTDPMSMTTDLVGALVYFSRHFFAEDLKSE